ncbi:MAG: ComEC/Rec2 family competence protein [Raoultibacter sp.]
MTKTIRGAEGKTSNVRSLLAIIALILIITFVVIGQTSNPLGKNAGSNATVTQQQAIEAARSSGIPAIKVDPNGSEKYAAPLVEEALSSASEDLPNNPSTLVVRYLDVGQGDCTLISCEGQNLLLDGGDSSSSSKIYSILERLNIKRLDYVIVTHPDADHCGGISGALSFAACGTCFSPTIESDTNTFSTLLRTLDKQGKQMTVPSLHDSFKLGKTTVTFVSPTQEFSGTNNASLIVRIDYGSTSFLFTGDAESPSEYALVADNASLSADVLKIGHHGSATSTTPLFLDAVNPAYAIISVGPNSYGHPSNTVLEDLASHGIESMRTDLDGTIIVKSNGSTLTFDSVKGLVNE